jgi:hypothetical protein
MSPPTLFLYVLMCGLALAALFVVGIGLWVLFLAVKGTLLKEPKE